MHERLNPYSLEGPVPIPDPRTIVTQTALLLPIYFSGTLEDEKFALDYFQGPTTNLVTNINRGFALTTGINLTNESDENLGRLIQSASDLRSGDLDFSLPRKRAIESFNLAVVIFSQMPELADYEKYSPIRSNKITVTPPRNSSEYIERINELKDFIKGITSNEIKQKHVRRLTLEGRIYRPLAFFQVGKDLPIKENPKKEEVIETLREALH